MKGADAREYDRVSQYYDRFFRGLPGERQFYVNEARNAHSILELASGTGRITIPIAKQGSRVTGLDVSERMLDIARKKAQKKGRSNISFVRGDMRSFSIASKFDLIIIPYNAFLHLLTRTDQKKALLRIRRHLKKDGRLIFSVFVPDVRKIVENHARTFSNRKKADVRLYETSFYDTFNQQIRIEFEFRQRGKPPSRSTIRLRYCFRDELLALLENAGFKLMSLNGGFKGEKLTQKSRQMVWTVKK
jgi:ubiquinone/menaquinone biosynthesis C-methylase UbiE